MRKAGARDRVADDAGRRGVDVKSKGSGDNAKQRGQLDALSP